MGTYTELKHKFSLIHSLSSPKPPGESVVPNTTVLVYQNPDLVSWNSGCWLVRSMIPCTREYSAKEAVTVSPDNPETNTAISSLVTPTCHKTLNSYKQRENLTRVLYILWGGSSTSLSRIRLTVVRSIDRDCQKNMRWSNL